MQLSWPLRWRPLGSRSTSRTSAVNAARRGPSSGAAPGVQESGVFRYTPPRSPRRFMGGGVEELGEGRGFRHGDAPPVDLVAILAVPVHNAAPYPNVLVGLGGLPRAPTRRRSGPGFPRC